MAYYQLPSGKSKSKPERTTKLKNLPRNYDTEFYISELGQIDNAFDSDLQQYLILNIRSNEDVQKYLLASSEISEHMQKDMDLLVTDDKLYNTSMEKLDLLYKNMLGRQNSYKLVLHGILTFGSQNPVTGSLLSEIDIGKQTKDLIDKKMKKAWSAKDVEIESKTKKKTKNFFFSMEIIQVEKMIVMMTMMMTVTKMILTVRIMVHQHLAICQNY